MPISRFSILAKFVVRTKGYSDIRIEDFPIRGRKTELRFRIRKWQAEGYPMIIQRKYDISAEGVKYSDEFAFFFEERNREQAGRYKLHSQA